MKLLDEIKSEAGFESQFAEIRGDIYLAMGESDKAIERYQYSLQQLEEGVGNKELLLMKLEALGESPGTSGGEM
jgi:predicted negative regulator of RcsB-dependent stress response